MKSTSKLTLTVGQLRRLVKEAAKDSDFEIKGTVLVDYRGEGGDVVIPDGITEIGDYAFCDKHKPTTSITIPGA